MPDRWAPGDEGRHGAGAGPWWAERWWFAWGDTATASAGFTELVLFPNRSQAWYRAALVRPGAPLLAIVDHDAPIPRLGLELRAEGLWADHTVEAAFEQWTVANEAYALALDDGDELIGRGYGTPEPMAFDVEWYASSGPVAMDHGYAQAGEVVGVVELGGGRRLDVQAPAARAHTWGPLTLPDVDDGADEPAAMRVPDRWPAPFGAVVDDVLTPAGWRRARRPSV